MGFAECRGALIRLQQARRTKMIAISLCMIVRDEEKSLGRCLASIEGVADEIIIVDTGSLDRTPDIARRFGAAVYDFEWEHDYAKARNYAFAQATKDYIMWLDADDVLLPGDREKLLQLKQDFSGHMNVNAVSMIYNLEQDENERVTASLRRNRLVKRSCGYQWNGYVHEYMEVTSPILVTDIAVTHRKDKAHTDRNLKIYRKRLQKGEALPVRDLYYFANELSNHQCYTEAIGYYQAFLDTGQGWVEDNIRACIMLSSCYHGLGDFRMAARALHRTFVYDLPRAEVCYRLGCYLAERKQVEQAVYWFEQALRLPPDPYGMNIVHPDYHTWLPHFQLSLCYDLLDRRAKANYHNELALTYKQEHSGLLFSKIYFSTVLGEQASQRVIR